MGQVVQQKEFKYHTKCKEMKLTHLCFADNMILFCIGEYSSVMLMLRGLITFSNTSRMTVNAEKSNIFCANMNNNEMEDLSEITGYKKGKLPFNYLGVPISPKKLNAVDCERLIDKILIRIKGWGSRNFSYAGRVQLVNTVLMHLHTYWASIFILPKKVMKTIVTICKNYLWDGRVITNKPLLVAWDIVCRPKRRGTRDTGMHILE
uniref:Uncharacterized protein n=2 Tax=Nicotiana TaxID=4085 RepID=A0A1S3XJ65_TOBAC|nr:PREDICTED: uncharacterized protein LOC104247316 [Nicotiana sylvestris]XP_016439722.1 PREDICTED: uncharacterized protein LOC107765571 [Nicotiana tabacum]